MGWQGPGAELREANLFQLNLKEARYSFVYVHLAKPLSAAPFLFELSPLNSLQCLEFTLLGAELSSGGFIPGVFWTKQARDMGSPVLAADWVIR